MPQPAQGDSTRRPRTPGPIGPVPPVAMRDYLDTRLEEVEATLGLIRSEFLRLLDARGARTAEAFAAAETLEQERVGNLEARLVAATTAAEKGVAAALVGTEKAIHAALAGADALERERVLAVHAQVESLRGELSLLVTTGEKAILKAEGAAERRFESVNEFRKSLSDQTAGFMTRAECETRIGAALERCDALQHRLDLLDGKSTGMSQLILFIFGTIGAIGAICGIVAAVYAATHR